MYGRPGGVGVGVGAGGLAATGFAAGLYVALALSAIVVGLLLLRAARLKRAVPTTIPRHTRAE